MTYNDTASIRNHYDVVSPYYRDLWGAHIHHGLWRTGQETAAEAQELLIEELISRARIPRGARILDAGCGIGGSSIYLAKNLGAKVTGITVSPMQVQMARAASQREGVDVAFELMDAQDLHFPPEQQFDCIWSIEAISHFADKQKFFDRASHLLAPGGVIALTDWFKRSGLTAVEEKELLDPIERGMLIELNSIDDYLRILAGAGNLTERTANLSQEVARTWDLCLGIIQDESLWVTARGLGADFVDFLASFTAMKNGYEAKALEYQLIVCRKPQAVRH
jgi:tocopherol O-methyltransferase